MNTPAPRFEAEPSVSNHFSWLRTIMGLQRTLMAAVRTAVSLIGFGFTVAQFFQRMKNVPGLREWSEDVPRDVGLVLIGAGVLSLVIFVWQYRTGLAYMRSKDFEAIAGIGPKPMISASYFNAWVVIVIGVVAFGSVFFRF
jgi:putative membrane protein